MHPGFNIHCQHDTATLQLSGDWTLSSSPADASQLIAELRSANCKTVRTETSQLEKWDSSLVSRLYQCWLWCQDHQIIFDDSELTDNLKHLLKLATAVPPQKAAQNTESGWTQQFNPLPTAIKLITIATGQMRFIGEICQALLRLVRGKATTRWNDLLYFIEQAGPAALGIVGLISVLVGMILAYLGAVQLALFGAEIYVANLVTVGTLREMGALMTAIIMAGRTGAAYAAQLGTMQVNEEIDAITTLGIQPIDFLVLPRLLALLIIMPMLCIYADVLGILGGVVVAIGMDVTPVQFVAQAKDAASIETIVIGLGKSLVFALVIAISGCKAGMESGRDSAAVGEATTKAVVSAIVWLVICDAVINIILSNLGI